jgi:hypothetical protein
MTPEPRKPLTRMQRLKLFEAHGGLCALCGQKIQVGEGWIDEHLRALGLLGTNDLDNRAPVHKACAAAKTFGPDGDLAMIAKAKRVKAKHLGLRKRSTFPGSRSGPLKKKVNGQVVRRNERASP